MSADTRTVRVKQRAAVSPVRLGGLCERSLRGIYAFTLLYPVVSAVAATLGNVGSGVNAVGPMNGYTDFA